MDKDYDAFISYSHFDRDWVWNWLLPRLESSKIRVCIDERDFDVGVASLVNIENAVKRSRKTLLVLTPNWIKSEWTNFESLLIQTSDPAGVRQRTLPLMLKKCEPPARLGILSHADFTLREHWEQQLARVLRAFGLGVPQDVGAVRELAPQDMKQRIEKLRSKIEQLRPPEQRAVELLANASYEMARPVPDWPRVASSLRFVLGRLEAIQSDLVSEGSELYAAALRFAGMGLS